MKKTKILALALALAAMAPAAIEAEHLVILAVNDTHSQVDPAADGKGGAARRRAIYDQTRRDNPNVMILHAGDAVQGTNYFSLYGGRVEYALMDSLGYDAVILGNHEFDNGTDSLAHFYNNVHATKLSANYDLSASSLTGFQPWIIKAVGTKRVAFFGINLNPQGMIAEGNYRGVRYIDGLKVADATAQYLKQVLGVDYAVMVSHIGYSSMDPAEPNDSLIVARSHYIDLVIGAHSHTNIVPGSAQSVVRNADGRPITIGQNGKSGKMVSRFDLDLDNGQVQFSKIDVDSRWDAAASQYTAMNAWLKPYRHGIDSLMNNPVALSARYMRNSSNALQNWVSDATMDIIGTLYKGKPQPEFAIMNKGGIRVDMPKGTVTEGTITSMFPFNNRFVVLQIKGSDLLEGLAMMANRGGDAMSKQLRVTFNGKGRITSAKLNGKQVKPEKLYTFVTIDYLANGGDYMSAFKRAKRLYVDDVRYGVHILGYVKQLKAQGRLIDASDEQRMTLKK